MTTELPVKANFTYLRSLAKDILKRHADGDESVCGTLVRLHRFRGSTHEGILSSDLSLQEVQKAVALEHGVKTWADLQVLAQTSMAELGGHRYKLEWVTPDRLAKLPLTATGSARARDTRWEYSAHADPLYNLHCEIGPRRPSDELRSELEEQGKKWWDYWLELARELPAEASPFAIVAYDRGKLAGHARFFPYSVGSLRWGVETGKRTDAQMLVIGAGYVDFTGGEDSLDVELIRRVCLLARHRGYARAQALAWSDIRVYAMWGESFPVSIYEQVGFRRIRSVNCPADAFQCMLGGGHGKAVRELAEQAAKEGGFTNETANDLFLVEAHLD